MHCCDDNVARQPQPRQRFWPGQYCHGYTGRLRCRARPVHQHHLRQPLCRSFTTPHTPQPNGVVERRLAAVQEAAQAACLDGQSPLSTTPFSCNASRVVNYIRAPLSSHLSLNVPPLKSLPPSDRTHSTARDFVLSQMPARDRRRMLCQRRASALGIYFFLYRVGFRARQSRASCQNSPMGG